MSEELRLALMGRLRLTLGATDLSQHLPVKAQALLCYLAMSGYTYSRQELAELFWGESPEEKARVSLRIGLTKMRQRNLEPYLVITRDAVTFNRQAAYWLDVEAFEYSLERGRQADVGSRPELLRQAIDLYRGDFLDGFNPDDAPGFEEWMLAQRERLRRLVLPALDELVQSCVEREAYDLGIDYANRLLVLDPWRESAHRQLMWLLARTGQRSAAMAQYETCRELLLNELGLEPDDETKELYKQIRAMKLLSADSEEQVHSTVTLLNELLEELYPEPPSPDVITFSDFLRRYRLTGLGAPAVQAIEQTQRINRALNNYRQMGLSEFHIGLFYLYWGQIQGGIKQFAQARQQWSFVDAAASLCLAHFAEGRAHHFAYDYEFAMHHYSKAAQWLARIHLTPPSNRLDEFNRQMTQYLQEWQARLRDDMLPDFKKLDSEGEEGPASQGKVTGILPFFPEDMDFISFRVSFQPSRIRVPVGGQVEVTIKVSPTDKVHTDSYVLKVSHQEAVGSDLSIFLTAPGFRFESDSVASLPLDMEATAQEASHEARFKLLALRSGSQAITADLYIGEKFEETLPTHVQVTHPDEIPPPNVSVAFRPRPVARPSFTLQIQTVWNEDGSSCTFQYRLSGFHLPMGFPQGMEFQSPSFTSQQLNHIENLLRTILIEVANGVSSDVRFCLTSFGRYMFQHLLPVEFQNELRSAARFGQTLIIIADQEAWLPWELLHDGRAFLSEHLIVGRWPIELNNSRPYEFPLGSTSVAHYADIAEPKIWTDLLTPTGAPDTILLEGGMLTNLHQMEAIRGLHLIRQGQPVGAVDREDAPVPLWENELDDDLESQLRPVKLNLRRNRPLTTLSYVNAGYPELTTLHQTWATSFIHAGSSAFVGPLWAVSPAVEATFITGFYQRLWMGDSLGEAFGVGRQLARAAVPDSLDWLAYVLYGDPMARPYQPVHGDGYAVVELIGHEVEEPLLLDTPVRCRISLRRTPPVWHHGRVVEVMEEFTFDNLQAHVKAFELQVIPSEPIKMQRTPDGNYLGWFTLSAPSEMAGRSTEVEVFLVDDRQLIHSVTLPFKIQKPEEIRYERH